jgi:hypothetical protein
VADLTRRGFVRNSAATAAGMTVIGSLVAAEGASADSANASGPVVAYVSDARKGEISVMAGDRAVSVRDRKLAAQIVRAAR